MHFPPLTIGSSISLRIQTPKRKSWGGGKREREREKREAHNIKSKKPINMVPVLYTGEFNIRLIACNSVVREYHNLLHEIKVFTSFKIKIFSLRRMNCNIRKK